MFNSEDIQANKSIVTMSSVLCIFFPVLFFIPLVSCKDSEYAKFYANNLLLLFIVDMISAATAVIFIGFVIGVMALVLAIMNASNASKGLNTPLPIIGGIKLIK